MRTLRSSKCPKEDEFTLISGSNYRIKTTKATLASNSQVFKALLGGEWKENKRSELAFPTLDKACLTALAKHLEGREDLKLTPRQAKRLAFVSDQYGLTQLRRLCAETLRQALDSDNFAEICKLADLLDWNLLKEDSLRFALKNITSTQHKYKIRWMLRSDPELHRTFKEFEKDQFFLSRWKTQIIRKQRLARTKLRKLLHKLHRSSLNGARYRRIANCPLCRFRSMDNY